MSDSNFSAIRARLRYESIEEFISGYARFISAGGMFIPMAPAKLKELGTTIRFQFLLADGSTALLGEGVVVQVRQPDEGNPKAPVGMLVKFSKLSQDAKNLVDQIVAMKDVGAVGVGSSPDEPEEPDESPAEDVAAAAAAGDFSEDQYDQTHEMSLDDFMAMDDQREAAAAEQAASDAQPTTEAPTPEPTEEAPAAEESSHRGPKKLAQTEGGLQILAFDDISEDEANALDFDFGAEESDVDEMFEGLFGGGDDGGGMFGGFGGDVDESNDGMFGGFGDDASPAQQSSVEFEVPSNPDAELELAEESEPEAELELVEEEAELELVEESEPEVELELLEESEPEAELELEESDPEAELAEESEPEAELELVEESEPEAELEPVDESEPEAELELAEASDELSLEELSDEIEQSLSEASDEAELELAEESDGEDAFDAAEFAEDVFQDEDEEGVSDPSEVELAAAALLAEDDDAPEAEDAEYQYDVVSSSVGLVSASEEAEAAELGDEASDEDEESLVLESAAVELIDGSEVEELIIEEEELPDDDFADDDFADEDDLQVSESGPSELENLLGNLESEPQIDPEMNLQLANDPVNLPEPPEPVEPDEEDEESLEFLLAAANREIEEKRGDEPEDDGRDILDDLLGEEANLPPPPSDTPVFPQQSQPQKKKGGFLSKLFGKD